MGPFQRTNNRSLKVSPPGVELAPPAQISSEMTTDLVGYSPSVAVMLGLALAFPTAAPRNPCDGLVSANRIRIEPRYRHVH